ncbi:MAG: ribosome-associated translation inhibitor RaiA [Planctomycetes bacterium]|nr:ribosome-associated translation inhibitor RaiA [Planctomycetota bacterium]
MQIVVTGRHMSVTDAMKAYAQEKAERVMRFFNRIQEIRVVLDFDGGRPTVEFIADVEHSDDFIARETQDDMYAAIDAAVDKLERQLRKHKERINQQRHKGKTGEQETAE